MCCMPCTSLRMKKTHLPTGDEETGFWNRVSIQLASDQSDMDLLPASF
jgi:hypothetical protein